MSNDSNYRIKVTGSRDKIEAVLEYIEEKSARWEEWQEKSKTLEPKKRGKAFKDAMMSFGLRKDSEFVTWGFSVESTDHKAKMSILVLGGWANENSTNCSISGPDGELAVLYEKFPTLDYSVEYSDDFSQGVCRPPYFEKEASEECEGTLDQIAIDLYCDGGEETLMDCLGTKTSQYKFLEEGVAEFIARHLQEDIDLTGLEHISEKDAKMLVRCKRIKVILRPELQEFVEQQTKRKKPKSKSGPVSKSGVVQKNRTRKSRHK